MNLPMKPMTNSLFEAMHAPLRFFQNAPPRTRPVSVSEELEDTLSVIATYIDPEPGESFRSLVYRMAGRCEERINGLEQAAAALAEAWSLFESGVSAEESMKPAVQAWERYIGEQWP